MSFILLPEILEDRHSNEEREERNAHLSGGDEDDEKGATNSNRLIRF
jgi:hypothetical protein